MKVDISLPDASREKIADSLSHLLADTFSLYLTTHYFHWNVKGMRFRPMHQMLEEQYNEIWNALDEIAERIRELGFEAPGSLSVYSKMSTLPEARSGMNNAEMLEFLVKGHGQVIERIRGIYPLTGAVNDGATGSLLDDRCSAHEKMAWMLRSMLEE
ncbi:DNA starvation/stationary phase protection protein [Plesiomonas shigelloides]|uniref:DNA starvation/stationary phase protection protein n=1 Tax=Plesiomonas shigelloides TaxID=703 RepID=A0A8I2B4E2_PLESH|nr:Dps family protein [Plesiomonas shigelloides]MBO1107860.1 DNA starvation/stationary phase protection protein [Plesiomonas shigelloides]PVU66657.1 DNA starvation/stationary phase protection protein [Plesiomonas shigelloides]